MFRGEVMVKERAAGTELGLPGQTQAGGAEAHVGLVIPGKSAFQKEKESLGESGPFPRVFNSSL